MESAIATFSYSSHDLAYGALAAIALTALLKLRIVAMAFAAAIALAVLYAIATPDGLNVVSTYAAERLTSLARSGTLAGFTMAGAASSVIQAAITHARNPKTATQRKPPRRKKP